MTFEAHEFSGATFVENRFRGFNPQEIKTHYRSWTLPIVRQVCSFLDHTDAGRSLPLANKRLLKHPDQLSKSVRLVTSKQLQQIIKPLLEAEGTKLPAYAVPFGFVHPKTRRIYISTAEPNLNHEIKKFKANPEVVLQSWYRRLLVEETFHRFQDLENIGRFFSEASASYYLREFYAHYNLPDGFMTPEDIALARVYERRMKKFGAETVNAICFGTYKGDPKKEAVIKLAFMLDGEIWERKRGNVRIPRRI